MSPGAVGSAGAQEDAAPRRILYLVDSYWHPHGGTEGQLRALIANLPRRWSAEVWVTHHSPWLLENPFPCPSRSLELGPLSRPWTHVRIRRLGNEVRARGCDLIQTFMGDAGLVGPLIGARAGVPVLVSRRDLGFWHTPRVVEAMRRVDRLAAGFVANAEAVKRHVVEVEHVPPDDVAVVHNGHDAAALAGARTPGLRAAQGIPESAVMVGLLANLKPLKRQPDLVAAVAALAAKHPTLHALFVGQGPEDEIREAAQRLGVCGRITIHHAQGGALDLVRECAVGVLCSETEGLSNAILEYMACGLPVVATDVGGNPELVVHGETGFLYAPGDVDALALHLGRILSDPMLAVRLGAAARARFETHFGLPRMVAETVAVYERALAGVPVGRTDPAGTARPAPPRGPLAFEVVDDLAGLEALADAWRWLLTPDQFFLSPSWVLGWLRRPSERATPWALVARDASGALVGLLPLARKGRGSFELCGAGLGADHLDVVAAPGRADEVASGALDRLLELPWRSLPLPHLAENGALRHAIRARRWRLPYLETQSTVCPYVRVEGSFDEYLARFTAKRRGNLRRALRAFREDPASGVRRVTDPTACAREIGALFDLHDSRFRERGDATAFTGPSLRAFHATLAAELASRGELALTFLTLDGRDVAAHYGFRFGGKLYHFQGGFDPAAASKSPGTALQMLVLEEDVFAAGLHEYDFLDGGESYKATFATATRRLYDVTLFRPTCLGRASAKARGVVGILRRAVRARLARKAAAAPPAAASEAAPSP